MAEKTHSDNINKQNEEHNMQGNNIEEFDPFSKKQTCHNSETNDLEIIEKSELLSDEVRNKQSTSDNSHNNETTSHHSQYNRSKSVYHEGYQERFSNIQRSKSVSEDPHNSKNNTSNFEEPEKRKIERNDQVARLLEPICEGIFERIELLGELLTSKKLDSVPDVYDEMANIVAATARNERLQAGPDGKRLLELTSAAKSNLNVDLHNLDVEIQRQFGLYSVEVTGDGACAFRATLISGMQQPDVYHSELRAKAIQQVLSDRSYYSTVLRPGDKVSSKELDDWVQAMDNPNTYGDEMANIAVADRYHIQLVIFRAGELLTVVNPRDGLVERTAFLVNVGTHYKALVSKSELDQARKNSERLHK